ncbi:hypothetical protein [Streptomyces tibetensis]|uniref:hypothetical protein n=1 Tax=Streptomyces tibetensis TaxID=2382123 RepID=UPI00340D62F8
MLGPILATHGLLLALITPATFTTSVAGAAVYTALALVSPGPVAPDWWLGLASAASSAATSAPGSCSALSPSKPSTQPRL